MAAPLAAGESTFASGPLSGGKGAGGIQIHAGSLSYLVGNLSGTPVYFHIWLIYLAEDREGFRVTQRAL